MKVPCRNKIILFIIIFIGCSIVISAQQLWQIDVQGGAGGTFLRTDETPVTYSDVEVSYAGIVGIQYQFHSFFSLRTEVMFERKGGSYSPKFMDGLGNLVEMGTADYFMNYISVPLLAQLHIGKKVRFFLNVGPSVGVLVNTSLRFTSPTNEVINYPDPGTFARVDIGLVTGLGCRIPLGERWIFSIEARTQTGFFPVENNDTFKKYNFNALMMAGVGYRF
jgi:hypothetical protein